MLKINAVYRLNLAKPVYLSTGTRQWNELPSYDNEAYMFCHPMWFFGLKSIFAYRHHKSELKKRGIRLILLHNSRLEYVIGLLSGFKGYLLNQNLHANENVFKIEEQQALFEAIYIAAAAPYKRIHLAKRIKKLFVVTYFYPDRRNAEGDWDLGLVSTRLSGIKHNRDTLSKSKVCELINQAKTGLALSKIEGAMWAIQEYLLCGIPVVTTWNLGGRGYYLNRANSLYVRATPKAVERGVRKLINKGFSREAVRGSALVMMELERERFVNIVTQVVGLERQDSNQLKQTWEIGLDELRVL